MKKIKVLIIAGSMNMGGQENQLMHIIRNSDKERFQIDYTSTSEDPYYKAEIEELGGRCHSLPKFNYKNPRPYCNALMNIFKKGEYDIIHSNELFHSGISVWLAKKAGIPVRIAHSHSGCDTDNRNAVLQNLYHKIMRNWINRYSTLLIACSSFAGKYLFGENAAAKEYYHLVFNSVETKKFINDSADVKGTDVFKPGYKSILHPAHIMPLKNQELLIEIAGELKRRESKVHIYCAGTGEQNYIDMLNNRIKAKDAAENISLIGPRNDIDVLMKNADAFTLPSKYEGMPLSLIEAQTAGLPCVVADTFSHEVDFGIGYVSWLSLNDSIEKWADEFENAVKIPKASNKDIIASIEKNGFDAELYAEKICTLYENAVKQL